MITMDFDTLEYITSPHYPQPYESYLNCIWMFSSHDNDGSFIVRFLHFSTEANFDVLTIGIGNDTSVQRIQEFHDANFVNSILLNVSLFWMTFKTDSRVASTGFVLTVERATYSGKNDRMFLKKGNFNYYFVRFDVITKH